MKRLGAMFGLLAMSCTPPESVPGLGLDLALRVHGGQLRDGGLPPDEGGPAVSQVMRPQPEVARGEGTVILSGRLGPDGVALHLHAKGDRAHWVLLPKGFDFVVTDELLWDAELGFSHAIVGDRLVVELQAADEDGRRGPIREVEFEIADDVPPAQLLVSLGWDAPVDLDLHVELPDGTIVGAKSPTSLMPAPGQVLPADAWMDAAVFPFDANQQCHLDLRNREDVVWASAPDPGTYRVYAHLFSACEADAVGFEATVQLGGRTIAEAEGRQYAFDAREHPVDGEAPGLLIAEFEVP